LGRTNFEYNVNDIALGRIGGKAGLIGNGSGRCRSRGHGIRRRIVRDANLKDGFGGQDESHGGGRSARLKRVIGCGRREMFSNKRSSEMLKSNISG
jgi:hypothetical protein